MKFEDKSHNWNEVLINNKHNKRITRRIIKGYYAQNINKIFPYLKDHDVLVIIGVGRNKFVLKRKRNAIENIHISKKYGIDDPSSLEYWINRRVIEFHPVIGEKTDRIWVDLDIYDGKKLNKKMLKYGKEIGKFLKHKFNAKVSFWDSGVNGIHIEGLLKRKIDVDKARRTLLIYLKELCKDDPDVTTGIPKHGQIRLDVTTLKNKGSIRAPWSFTVVGGIKEPLK